MNRKYQKPFIAALWLVWFAALSSARAQESKNSKPEPATTTKVINLWPSVAPGSEQWEQQETTMGSGGMETTVNVVTPTLTAYLPDATVATGTAVIIAPGGGFIGLSLKWADCAGYQIRPTTGPEGFNHANGLRRIALEALRHQGQ